MDTTTLRLPADQPHRLRHAASTLLSVQSGRVWLTEPGQLDDHFLDAGQSHRIASDQLVLIEGQQGGAVVALHTPAQPDVPSFAQLLQRLGRVVLG